MWYVANSPKLTKSGATKPLLDSYHRACCEAMIGAGLLDNNKEAIRTWEDDLEERFMAYKSAYENVNASPDFAQRIRVSGRGSIGWLLSPRLFPGQPPGPGFVILMNEIVSLEFRKLVQIVTDLEAAYRPLAEAKKRWWKFWK